MTRFVILSIFPEMFNSFVSTSILKRAIDKKLISVEILDIRDFAKGKNRKVDDTPYGGGSGMVMMCEPLDLSIDHAINMLNTNRKDIEIIYLSPRGKLLKYSLVKKLAKATTNYILICGHYEGIDERIIEKYNVKEISIGDYVLTGGEIPAMVLADSISRLIPGVITQGSLEMESHTDTLLEHPHYTKPSVYKGLEVPEILLGGNHKKIEEYRRKESILITYKNRKDLITKALKSGKIKKNEVNIIKKEKDVK